MDSKMVHKSFCNKSNMKPRGDVRDCNQKPCPPPMCVGAAGRCPNGLLPLPRSTSLCFCVPQLGDGRVAELQQSLREDGHADPHGQLHAAVGGQHHALHPQQTLQRQPAGVSQGLQPTPLPHPVEGGTLVAGTPAFPSGAVRRGRASATLRLNRAAVTCLQCSVSCGNGTQQRKALCHTRDNTIGLCLDSKPDTIRVCRQDPCPSEWTPDVLHRGLVARLHFQPF